MTHTKPTLNPLTGGWIKLSDRLPITEFDGERVLIYTEGYDFAGQQVFDVKTDHLNECFFADPEEQMPEVCQAASHWMPLVRPAP